MRETNQRVIFGAISECNSLSDVLEYIRHGSSQEQQCAAAYGLFFVASQTMPKTHYRIDALHVLNDIARAKAEIDIASFHNPHIIAITSVIVSRAQQFADEMTIPCTEWPLPQEIVDTVYDEACRCCL